MTRSESSNIIVTGRGSMPGDEDSRCTIVWLRGDHDIATKLDLVVAIARAAQRDDGTDLILDLSGVTFMDVSTIAAIVGSRNRLLSRSQFLHLRAPSAAAQRVLDLCGIADLLRPSLLDALHPAGEAAALGTWVDVPPTEPDTRSHADTDPTTPSEESHLARTRRRTAAAAGEADRGDP